MHLQLGLGQLLLQVGALCKAALLLKLQPHLLLHQLLDPLPVKVTLLSTSAHTPVYVLMHAFSK